MGYAVVDTATVEGVQAQLVHVEVHVASGGLPQIKIVGLGDTAVMESRERVIAVLKACRLKIPATRITVNLAPALVKKHGSGFDVAIALGIACASGQIDPSILKDNLFVGELSLSGEVCAVSGQIAAGLLAKREGKALVGRDVSPMCAITRTPAHDITHFSQFVGIHSFAEETQCHQAPSLTALSQCATRSGPDFRDVAGHETAIRALQVAAAGRHNILLLGPPGAGKTLLASCFPSIIPPLTEEESLETALVYASSATNQGNVQFGEVPFRAPHHSTTIAGLVGGGNPLCPGEVSLAHNGILFLDEMAQFAPSALQAIRTPMQDEKVILVRSQTQVEFPSRFLLIAASNPCPCGYWGSRTKECSCSPATLTAYQNRIGGPLIDRFDMICWIDRVNPSVLLNERAPRISSEELRKSVLCARAFQSRRRASHVEADRKEDMLSSETLSSHARELLLASAQKEELSTRGMLKVLRVARTCADLAQEEVISERHMSEALYYRNDWKALHVC